MRHLIESLEHRGLTTAAAPIEYLPADRHSSGASFSGSSLPGRFIRVGKTDPGVTHRLTRVLWLLLLTLLMVTLLYQVGAGSFNFSIRLGASRDPDLDALMTAIEMMDAIALREVLHKPGLELNRRDDQGNTALTRAARMGWVEGVQMLLGCGADPNLSDDLGGKPLSYAILACGPSAIQLVDLLMQHGADVNGRGNGGRTALINVGTYRRVDLVRRLIAAGADVNIAADNGWTALHWAAMSDEDDATAVLLAAGANPNAVDDEVHTPLDVAREYHSAEAAARLLQRTLYPR